MLTQWTTQLLIGPAEFAADNGGSSPPFAVALFGWLLGLWGVGAALATPARVIILRHGGEGRFLEALRGRARAGKRARRQLSRPRCLQLAVRPRRGAWRHSRHHLARKKPDCGGQPGFPLLLLGIGAGRGGQGSWRQYHCGANVTLATWFHRDRAPKEEAPIGSEPL